MKRLLMSFLFCAGLVLVSAQAQERKDAKPSDDPAEGPQVGQPAPDFEVPWADQTDVHTAKN